jgi:hypothetical protein
MIQCWQECLAKHMEKELTSTDDSRQHPEGIDKTLPLQTTENALKSFLKLNCYQHCVAYSENYFWNEIVFGLFRLSRLIERTLNLA